MADPELKKRNLPPGYMTTKPGKRGDLFYHLSGADPKVIAFDEATKDTFTPGEVTDLYEAMYQSVRVRVPVLWSMGEFDTVFCGVMPCSSPGSNFTTEATTWPQSACYEQILVPGVGHDINLHRAAPSWFDQVGSWLDRLIGADALHPVKPECHPVRS
jgi:hypothetical protein